MATPILTDQNFQSEVQKKPVALVDYFASWCGSCRLFAPIFDKVAQENPDLAFYKIDGDENPQSHQDINIDNLPFVAIFENGHPVGGLNITTEEALRDLVGKVKKKLAAK